MPAGSDRERPHEDVKERAEPDRAPVDGPSSGSGGEQDERDLSSASQSEPGGSGA